ncbi:uncharacterized protein LOC144716472 [Wolffia australiana]
MGMVKMITKAAGMVRMEGAGGKKVGGKRDGNWRRQAGVGRRWRPSLSSIAEEGAFCDEVRTGQAPSAVQLKAAAGGGAHFAISIAKARLWGGGACGNNYGMNFGQGPFTF